MNIQALLPLIVQASLMLIVASVGLQAQWRDLDCAIRRPGLLLRGIAAVNLVVPAAAVAVSLVLPIEPLVRAGIIIMAVSPLAPFLPAKLLQAGVGASVAVGLYVALMLAALIIVPVTFALLSAMFGVEATLPVETIAAYVLTSVLLPLIVGLAIAWLMPAVAPRLAKIASAAGMLMLLPLFAILLWRSAGELFALFGDGTVLAIVVTVAVGLGAGHLLGGPDPAERSAIAAAAAARHPGIASLVASRHFDDRRVMLTIILFLVVSLVVSALYSAWAARRQAGQSPVFDGEPAPEPEPQR
jgi:bile acid:Na+ symporter, BASS family